MRTGPNMGPNPGAGLRRINSDEYGGRASSVDRKMKAHLAIENERRRDAIFFAAINVASRAYDRANQPHWQWSCPGSAEHRWVKPSSRARHRYRGSGADEPEQR